MAWQVRNSSKADHLCWGIGCLAEQAAAAWDVGAQDVAAGMSEGAVAATAEEAGPLVLAAAGSLVLRASAWLGCLHAENNTDKAIASVTTAHAPACDVWP